MSTPVLHHESAPQEPRPGQGPGDATDQQPGPDGQSAGTSASGLAAQSAERRAKRDELRNLGINPYPTRFDRTATLAELHAAHAELEPDTRTGEVAAVAGRVASIRGHGKLRFVTIEDASGAIQLMFQADHLPEDAAAVEALVDLGDWVGATGEVITSRRGELSIDVTGLEILSKALRPLPDKWHGLNEAETRYRQREVDLLANKESRRVFDIRFKTLSVLRNRLEAQHFVEVETPDPAAAGRRGHSPPVLHSRQRAGHRVQPAHRAGAVPQAAGRRRLRAGVRDRPQLPQRGDRHPAQPGVHLARGLPGLRRLPRRNGPHRAPDHRGRPGSGRPARLRRRRPARRPDAAVAAPRPARPARRPARPAGAPVHAGGGRPRRSARPTTCPTCRRGVRES